MGSIRLVRMESLYQNSNLLVQTVRTALKSARAELVVNLAGWVTVPMVAALAALLPEVAEREMLTVVSYVGAVCRHDRLCPENYGRRTYGRMTSIAANNRSS